MTSNKPARDDLVTSLRLVYLLSFMGQLVVVLLVGVLLGFVLERPATSSARVAQVLLVFGVLELPIGLALAFLLSRDADKQSALASLILLGVMLSTPAWFALFAFFSGSPVLYVVLQALLLALYYPLGVLAANPLARRVRFEEQEIASDEEKEEREKSTQQ